ncbi:hypothetical protein KSP40_PGU006039 [Platanthera guangdongensis]|uniref:Uncharacterized protein n=1 Tax=Platanthera guangdongensis TaxID=2320717 RepID=A0ABR2MVL4_9ASPA
MAAATSVTSTKSAAGSKSVASVIRKSLDICSSEAVGISAAVRIFSAAAKTALSSTIAVATITESTKEDIMLGSQPEKGTSALDRSSEGWTALLLGKQLKKAVSKAESKDFRSSARTGVGGTAARAEALEIASMRAQKFAESFRRRVGGLFGMKQKMKYLQTVIFFLIVVF